MKTLVLIPGFGFKSDVWDGFISELSASYNILKIDLLSEPKEMFTYLESEVPEDSFICGWSLGGLLATRFCALFPERHCKLITIASSPNFKAVLNLELFYYLKNLLKEDLGRFVNSFISLVLYPDPRITNIKLLKQCFINDPESLDQYLEFLVNENVLEQYRGLNQSSFHVICGNDHIVSHETLSQWQSNKHSQTYINDEFGHYPFLQNNILIPVIEQWIKQNKK